MKPQKLTMNSFGSYANPQTIDFAKLGTNGLYLITGETGSGKTTIFDAISFALFGKASGTSRSDYSMLRSDFADGKDKTFVELDFLAGSALYNIKRTIKKSGQDAALLLPDGTLVSGHTNVNNKISEIVGLEKEQFAQIVMIAQNDFLRFLQSKMEDRIKILRHIFGTATLRRFQDRLRDHAKQEIEKRERIVYDFQRHDVDVYKRGEFFAEWEAQIKIDKAGLAKADKDFARYDKIKQELAVRLNNAEGLNRKFSDLASARVLLEKHLSRAGEIELCKTRTALGETALRKVKPLADEAAKTAAGHASLAAGLETARKQEAAALKELEQAETSLKGLPPLEEAKTAFAALSKNRESRVEQLKKLNVLRENRDEIEGRQTALSGAQRELAAVGEALDGLPSLGESQASLELLAQELANTEAAHAKLSVLQTELAVVNEKRAALSGLQEELEALNKAFAEADGRHRLLEEAFFRGQAGILAGSLEDGKACPVCGSVEHPNLAAVSAGDVTEAELRKAKDAKESAQNRREKKSLECKDVLAKIETLYPRFVAGLSEHAPGVMPATAETRLAETADAVKAKLEELTKKKTAAEKSFAELKTKLEVATENRNRLTAEVAAIEGGLDSLVNRFANDFSEFAPGCEWEKSKTELAKIHGKTQKEVDALTADKQAAERSLEELNASWELAAKRKSSAESACRSAQTLAEERYAKEREASKLRADAQAEYGAALQTHGFPSEAEYAAALVTEDELASMSKLLADYDKNGERLARDIERLESETSGEKLPDMEKLKAEAETANAESATLDKARGEIKSRLDKAETKLKELRRAAAGFELADKSCAAAKQLSEAASGRFDFETFAQTAYFDRVLAAANRRLNAMSQNRYALTRKTESGDGRLKTGLEIEAFDAYTGKARSANSLSGGESFMASLSLALGLSDVVQQSAGGIRLDAMFIDEGFGTLDTETLDISIKTLSEMAGTDRIIGIISHVTELRERVERQIRVDKTTSGSIITVCA